MRDRLRKFSLFLVKAGAVLLCLYVVVKLADFAWFRTQNSGGLLGCQLVRKMGNAALLDSFRQVAGAVA